MAIPPYVLQAIKEVLAVGYGEIIIKIHQNHVVSVRKSILSRVLPPEKQPAGANCVNP